MKLSWIYTSSLGLFNYEWILGAHPSLGGQHSSKKTSLFGTSGNTLWYISGFHLTRLLLSFPFSALGECNHQSWISQLYSWTFFSYSIPQSFSLTVFSSFGRAVFAFRVLFAWTAHVSRVPNPGPHGGQTQTRLRDPIDRSHDLKIWFPFLVLDRSKSDFCVFATDQRVSNNLYIVLY